MKINRCRLKSALAGRLLLAALAWLTLSPPVVGQSLVRYRRQPAGQLCTAAQLDSLLQARNQKLRPQGMLLEKQLGATELRHDTLFQDYSLRVTTQAVRANEQRYLALVGQPLPNFAGRDLAGQPVSRRRLVGRPLVINLWFTNCPPCLAEIPALNQVRAQHPAVAFLAMTYEPRAKVRAFLKTQAFEWSQLTDAQAYCAQFTQDYPISIFVDRQGIIRRIIGGMPQTYDVKAHKPGEKVNPTQFLAALREIEQ